MRQWLTGGFLMLLLLLLAACNGDNSNSLRGEAAPQFILPETRGNVVALSDFSGKPVLLYFHMAVG